MADAQNSYGRNRTTRKEVASVYVGYERYSMQADIEHFESRMKIEKVYIPITEVAGSSNKDDRIRRLIPDHQNGQFFYPEVSKVTGDMITAVKAGKTHLVATPIKRKNHEGKVYEFTEWFLRNEYQFFPHSTVKDALDAMSRIYDLDITPPLKYKDSMLTITNDKIFPGPSYVNGQCLEPDAEWMR